MYSLWDKYYMILCVLIVRFAVISVLCVCVCVHNVSVLVCVKWVCPSILTMSVQSPYCVCLYYAVCKADSVQQSPPSVHDCWYQACLHYLFQFALFQGHISLSQRRHLSTFCACVTWNYKCMCTNGNPPCWEVQHVLQGRLSSTRVMTWLMCEIHWLWQASPFHVATHQIYGNCCLSYVCVLTAHCTHCCLCTVQLC